MTLLGEEGVRVDLTLSAVSGAGMEAALRALRRAIDRHRAAERGGEPAEPWRP